MSEPPSMFLRVIVWGVRLGAHEIEIEGLETEGHQCGGAAGGHGPPRRDHATGAGERRHGPTGMFTPSIGNPNSVASSSAFS